MTENFGLKLSSVSYYFQLDNALNGPGAPWTGEHFSGMIVL